MKRMRLAAVVSLMLMLTGCYAASIDTGRPPSSKVIKQPWATGWIFGLVPPKTVETAAQCPNGVSRVETQLSFLNMLVGNLTLGIYTPMQIVVTCAEAGAVGFNGVDPDIIVPDGATREEVQAAFARAADQAMMTRQPVYVRTASVGSGAGDFATGTR